MRTFMEKIMLPKFINRELRSLCVRNPTIFFEHGHTLHYECALGRTDMIRHLIENNHDVNEVVLGETPLEVYLNRGNRNIDIVRKFLDRQDLRMQNLPYQNGSIATTAAISSTEIARLICHDKRVKFIYNSYSPAQQNEEDNSTTLIALCSLGFAEALQFVMDEFTSDELHIYFQEPISKNNCLTCAVENGSISCINILKRNQRQYRNLLKMSLEPNDLGFPNIFKRALDQNQGNALRAILPDLDTNLLIVLCRACADDTITQSSEGQTTFLFALEILQKRKSKS